MISLSILKAKGLTDKNLKEWLTGDPLKWLSSPLNTATASKEEQDAWPAKEKRGRWHQRMRSRISNGQQSNWEDWRTYAALDKAWDMPLYQITPTILASFIDSNPNSENVQQSLASWGLASMIEDVKDPKSGQVTKKLNLPVFFKVFVPLVRAYVTIRWAKIMNDRRQTPFFKYEPFKQTTELRAKCEALTDRVNVIANQFGYYDTMKQSVFKMLHYSWCIQFVTKAWDYEEQWREATAEDVALKKMRSSPTETNKDEKVAVQVGDVIKVTEREGIAYNQPHPGRTFVDLGHGKHTINYDSGVKFGGYWKIQRLGELKSQGFWNTDAIGLGTSNILTTNRAFFETLYPCVMNYSFPTQTANPAISARAVPAATTTATTAPVNDRETKLTESYYGDWDDQGVMVTEYFEKLVPKDCGLGEYDCPVWFRVVVAGDGATILFAEPLPYNPMIYYGYDADESRTKNPSLSLEVLPFQDHFGNTLTQIIKTATQNLANMSLVDEDQLAEGQIDRIRNMGSQFYQGLNVFSFSSKRAARMQNRPTDVLHSFSLPKGNVAELTGVLKTILDVLERILVMSSQEVAQAASHEQTREEVRVISASMSTRLQFTSTPVDIATSAWKRQIYQGLMEFGDDDGWAHLPSDIVLSKEQLEKWGFTYVDNDASTTKDRYRQVRFKKSAVAVDMWQFANTRDDTDRGSDKEVAVALASITRDLLNNPMTAAAIGADQAIDLANSIGHLAGAFPRDYKLKNAQPHLDEQQRQQQAQEELKAITDTVLAQVHKEMQQGIEPLLEGHKQQEAEIEQNKQATALLMTAVEKILQQANIQMPMPMG